jgi:hypothetical protein
MALTRIDSNMFSGSPTQLDYKQSVRCATTASITLSGLQTIDGISVVDLDRVLVKDQGTASQNGIYVVSTGAWARSSDMDISNEVTSGAFCYVEAGTSNAASGWALSTTGAIVVGSTNLTYVQITGLGQVTVTSGLTKTGNTISVASGGVTAAKLNADVFTTARSQTNQTLTDASNVVYASAGPSGSAFSFRNKIIGGDFTTNPWQRGTSFTAPAHGAYTADRFVVGHSMDGVVNVIKTADAPTATQAGSFTQHCLHVDVTTADTSIAATQYYSCYQMVEGLNAACFGFGQAGTRYVTLSFWHKHTKTGIYCVSIGNGACGRSYVAEYTQAVTDVWEKAVITIPVDTSGTWLYDNGVGIRLWFTLAAGTSYQTTANTWTAGNYLATANQVNALDSTANNFKIALVQLEAGSVATPFEHRPYGTELALCQRYFFRGVYAYATNPTPFFFKTTMRANPTCTPESGTTFGTSYPDLVNVISGTVGAYYTGSASAEL